MKKRALISVYKKEGIVDFAKELASRHGFEIVSTGGTAKLLRENLIPVIEVSELTKYPEMLEGRVKTLHPVIHGGILAKRNKEEHKKTISQLNIEPIDLIIINLYPFEEGIANPNISLEEAIELIDIGGPAMIRSAAKNYPSVTVVCDMADLPLVQKELEENNGNTTVSLREKLAAKAFLKTSEYDKVISAYLSKALKSLPNGKEEQSSFPETLNLNLTLKQVLRYGENPHQRAALYLSENSTSGLANAKQVQGKELSFNNYLDLESAWNLVSEFDALTPSAVIVKHNIPCGVSIAPTVRQAYLEAYNADPVSAFGGIVAFNAKVENDLANELSKVFLEAIIAPDYSEQALEILKTKPNLRVLQINTTFPDKRNLDIRRIGQGYLIQDCNIETLEPSHLKTVTKRKPTKSEMIDLIFAWKVCKHVKSNAIVVAKEGKTVGIGAGQTSRVSSVEIAINQANYNTKDAVLASDAFFPFKDSIEIAASARIAAIIQPGGSIRDKEIIETCDKYNIAMVFTGMRHFKH